MSVDNVADTSISSDTDASNNEDVAVPVQGRRAVQGGGDAFWQALPRAYDHTWLMDFNHPHGQMILDTDDDIEPSEYGIFFPLL